MMLDGLSRSTLWYVVGVLAYPIDFVRILNILAQLYELFFVDDCIVSVLVLRLAT